MAVCLTLNTSLFCRVQRHVYLDSMNTCAMIGCYIKRSMSRAGNTPRVGWAAHSGQPWTWQIKQIKILNSTQGFSTGPCRFSTQPWDSQLARGDSQPNPGILNWLGILNSTLGLSTGPLGFSTQPVDSFGPRELSTQPWDSQLAHGDSQLNLGILNWPVGTLTSTLGFSTGQSGFSTQPWDSQLARWDS